MQHQQPNYDGDNLAEIWQSAQHRRTEDIHSWFTHFFERRGNSNQTVADLNIHKVPPPLWKTARRHFRLWRFSDTEVPMVMKHRTITGFVAVALLAATTTAATMRSHTASVVRAAGLMSLQEPAAGVNKLPIEDFEDMSLVYSTTTKH